MKPLHSQVAYKHFPRTPGGLTVSEALPERILCLPMHPYLTREDQDLIISTIRDFVGGNSQNRYVRDNQTVDLRVSYNINRNISLRAEATNITDEPKVTDMPVPGSIRQYHYYGPRYFLGARFRL